MSQNPSSVPAPNDDATHERHREPASRARLVLVLAAVALAVTGLLALLTVLISAWVGVEPWPGFVAVAYFCLPLGFLLMILTVIVSIISRRRT